MTSQRMPTPWRMDVDQAGCKTLVSVENDSYEIASHLDQSNAEFILRCVNEREGLRNTLKMVQDHLRWESEETKRKWSMRDQKIWEIVDNAIKQTEEPA